MRRNPLLYSDHSETEVTPEPFVTEKRDPPPGESSFLFYIIILANSLLVLFVLGFIWFLFLKSPDLQIKELTNRFFGASQSSAATQPALVAPEIKTEIVITPSQQEKDETQQAKLKQMREKEELESERTRIEAMKAEIALEKARVKEAQEAITNLGLKQEASETDGENTQKVLEENAPVAENTVKASEEPVEIEQSVVKNAASEPVENENSTQSQIDLIMETLKQQQTQTSN